MREREREKKRGREGEREGGREGGREREREAEANIPEKKVDSWDGGKIDRSVTSWQTRKWFQTILRLRNTLPTKCYKYN